MRCIGRTKTWSRCKIETSFLLCGHHKWQPVAIGFFLVSVLAVLGGFYHDVFIPITKQKLYISKDQSKQINRWYVGNWKFDVERTLNGLPKEIQEILTYPPLKDALLTSSLVLEANQGYIKVGSGEYSLSLTDANQFESIGVGKFIINPETPNSAKLTPTSEPVRSMTNKSGTWEKINTSRTPTIESINRAESEVYILGEIQHIEHEHNKYVEKLYPIKMFLTPSD